MKKNIPLVLLALLLVSSCTQKDMGNEPQFDAKVKELLGQMTLEEKIGQMNQYNGFWEVTGPPPTQGDAADKYADLEKGLVGSMLNVNGVENVRKVQEIIVNKSRLGIPLLTGYDVIHGYQTLSPIPLAEAASWDLEAIAKSSSVAATEASAAGINWTFAPMIDVSRDARWGRVMEGAGEDPFLGAKIAQARINGFQGNNLDDVNTIAACAKHFAAYGLAESGKDYNTVDVSMSRLHNLILPPFKASVYSGVKTIMTAFNDINGEPATSNKYLLTDLLKEKWGFEGFVLSDWASIKEIIDHGRADSEKMAGKLAVEAGCDMDMASEIYLNHLKELVENGTINEQLIDDAVARILQVKFELGLFDDPYKYLDEEREKELMGNEKHHQAVLDMAKKSMVLLKNESNLLPLKNKSEKIAVIGPLANDKNTPLGNWRAKAIDSSAVSVVEGLQNSGFTNFTYSKGCDFILKEGSYFNHPVINDACQKGFDQAIKVARNANVVIMVLGEGANHSGEARSRAKLGLPGVQLELLKEVYKANKNIVLVLMNGRPLAIPWEKEHIPAIVEAWHLGSQSGNAIAQVLSGQYNPSGKLPMTFPRSVGQVPIYYNYKITGRPWDPNEGNVFLSGYVDESVDPLFPFGFGLSYTTFNYSDLKVIQKGEFKVAVSAVIKNTGKVKGEEVAQLYIRDRVASVIRPVKELKGFKKVMLAPGESKKVEFLLTQEELGFYNNNGEYLTETGEFDIWVGTSSAEGLHKKITIE